MNSTLYTVNEIFLIIGGYIVASVLWFIMGCAHVRWGTKNSFSGVIFSFLWLWYGYRNYDFFFIKLHIIDEQGFWYNVAGVLVLDVCSFYMAAPYFKHIKVYILKIINR